MVSKKSPRDELGEVYTKRGINEQMNTEKIISTKAAQFPRNALTQSELKECGLSNPLHHHLFLKES